MITREDTEGLIDLVDFGQKSAAKALIERKYNVNVCDKFGNTPALFAAKDNDLEIMKMLIDAGADLQERNFMGQDPLFWAQFNESQEMIDLITMHLNSQKSS
jgi:ankyrin repeat protein